MNIQLWVSLLPWLFLLASSTTKIINNTDSNELGPLRNVCISSISQLVTYYRREYFTRAVRTQKCRLLVFCKTVYRLQQISRLQKRRRTIYRMKAHCCDGFVKVENLCISDTTPTPDPATSKIVSTSEISSTSSLQLPNYDGVRITSGGSQNTIIAVTICMVVTACIIAAFIVAYRRRKKAGKSASEIPCDKEVLSLSPNSRNNWDLPEGLDCNVTAAEEENYYVSMNNGFNSDTPNVNRMLSTRGSRYRFADLDEGNCSGRTRADTLYVLPDPKFRQGGGVNTCEQTKGAAAALNGGSTSNIYVNHRQESSREISPDNDGASNDDDDIYSEIKTSTDCAQETSYCAAYEELDQGNKTDVNGNSGGGGCGSGGGHGEDVRSGCDVKRRPTEVTELSRNDEDTYDIPKSRSRYNKNKRALFNDHGDDDGDDGDDDDKNNNGSDNFMEGCRSKTCDSGIYIYLNSKEEDEGKEEEEEKEEETDFIYSVPYSNNNNNNNNPPYSDCSDTEKPRRQRSAAAVKSLVYQNAALSGGKAERNDDTAMINTPSPSPSSSSPSSLSSPSSSSSLRKWPNNGTTYRNVPNASSEDQTLYQDIGNTKKEFTI